MKKISRRFALSIVLPLLGFSFVQAETSLKIVPDVFDFGWVPDNALVRCEFHIKNIGGEMVPLTAVQPSCGCTATDFTPDALPASEEKVINLTFNTRGYAGMPFDKSAKVKAGMPEEEFSVRLKGHVTDASSVVFPDGSGIATFENGKSKTSLVIKNKTGQPMDLKIIQDCESWAEVLLPKKGLPATGDATLEVKVEGSLSESRQTSATLEASDGTTTHRFTIAIRTGEAPEAYRKIRTAPKSAPAAAPTLAPKKSQPKKKT